MRLTFSLTSNKKNQFEFNILNKNELLSITSKSIKRKNSSFYETKKNLKNLKNNRYFRLFNNIDEILFELENKFKKSILIEETKKLILIIPLL